MALRFSYEEKARQTGRTLESHRALLSSPWQGALWPPAPFLVPSLIEGLLSSKYAKVTKVMPGEADHYCTVAARELTSADVYIFTNDSDLLVLNTMNDTRIVMLSSLAHIEGGLCADVYNPTAIVRSVGLNDMLKVAYKMKMDPHLIFDTAAARVLQEGHLYAAGYKDFLAEIEGTAVSTTFCANQQECLDRMDPRLSELIHRLIAQEPDAEPSMFLPFLVDDLHKGSAWKCGSSLRKLAYSVLSGTAVKTINEFDRKGTRMADTKIALHTDVQQAVCSHQTWLEQQVLSVQTKGIKPLWRAVGGIMLLCDLQAQDKSAPSLADITSVIHKRKLCSWTQIHLSVQLEAVMYSFRMLKLALEFVLAGPNAKDDGQVLTKLSNLLVDLPSMLQLFDPLPEIYCDTYCELVRPQCHIDDTTPRPRKRAKKTSTGRESTKNRHPDASKTLASNPFAMLAE